MRRRRECLFALNSQGKVGSRLPKFGLRDRQRHYRKSRSLMRQLPATATQQTHPSGRARDANPPSTWRGPTANELEPQCHSHDYQELFLEKSLDY